MIIYFIALILTLVLVIFCNSTENKTNKKILMIASVLPFFIILALRDDVGIDTWLNYRPTFENVALYGDRFDVLPFLLKKYEIGFSILVMILAKISTNSVILFSFCSFEIILFTFMAIYEQSKNKILSILLFFLSGSLLLSMNGMRNYMALAIVLYALKYIDERKLFKYICFILLASLLHKSVLIFLLLYPLYNFKISKNFVIISIALSIPLTFFIDDIAYIFLQWTSYLNYFNSVKSVVNPLYSMTIINAVILMIFLINYDKYCKDNKYNLYLKLQLISLIICIFSFKVPLAYRLEQIFDFLQIITIPYNIYLIKKQDNNKLAKILVVGVLVIYSIYFTKVFITADDNQVRDYKCIIFNKES